QTRFAALDQTVAGFRVVGRRLPGPWEMDIGEAEVVVAGGKGVATKEAFGLLAELAGLLGGAVGASRPVVDVGLVPPSRQVGLSGRTITPRLYIACGISGSPHHLVGMRGSGSVISINSDPHAPIHALSDVRLVGDAAVLLPRLIEQVRSRTETRRAALRELSEVRV
ncbi:MAG: electron transfer flavoprotein subunit alpha/FixB family protein, partial [Dehalococcoidia bacterium]